MNTEMACFILNIAMLFIMFTMLTFWVAGWVYDLVEKMGRDSLLRTRRLDGPIGADGDHSVRDTGGSGDGGNE